MVTSKITSCRFLKTYESKFGTMYAHYITLANGDEGEISAKNEMPAKLAVGQELTYELTPNANPKYPPKIKSVSPKFAQQNTGYAELVQRMDKLEHVIKSLVKNNKLIYVQDKPVVQQHPIMTPSGNSTINQSEDDLPF